MNYVIYIEMEYFIQKTKSAILLLCSVLLTQHSYATDSNTNVPTSLYLPRYFTESRKDNNFQLIFLKINSSSFQEDGEYFLDQKKSITDFLDTAFLEFGLYNTAVNDYLKNQVVPFLNVISDNKDKKIRDEPIPVYRDDNAAINNCVYFADIQKPTRTYLIEINKHLPADSPEPSLVMPLSTNIQIQNFTKTFKQNAADSFLKTVVLPHREQSNSIVRPFQQHILATLKKQTEESKFRNSFAQTLTTAIEPVLRNEIWRRETPLQNGCDWIGQHQKTTLAVAAGVLALGYAATKK